MLEQFTYRKSGVNENVLQLPESSDLSGAGDMYVVRDLRTRSRKEPGEVQANKNLNFVKIQGEEIGNFNRKIYDLDKNYFGSKIEGYKQIFINITKNKDNQYFTTEFSFFRPDKKVKLYGTEKTVLGGFWNQISIEVEPKKVFNYVSHNMPEIKLVRPEYDTKGRDNKVFVNKFSNYETNKYVYGFISDTYYNELRKKAFDNFFKGVEKSTRFTDYQKKLCKDFYENPQKYDIVLINYSGEVSSKIDDKEKDEFVGLLSGYGDRYTVRDNRKRAKKEPGELVANKNLVFSKGQSDIINYNHLISSNNPDYKLVDIERKTNFSDNKNEWFFKVGFFECEKKTNENITTGNDYYQKGQDGKAYKGFKRYYAVLVDESDLINLQKYNSGIDYKAYITIKLYNDLKNKAFGLFLDSLKRSITYYEDELRKEKERFNNPAYGTNIESKKKWLAMAEENLKNAKKVLAYNYAFYGIKNDSEGLGKPLIKFEFETNEQLKKFLSDNKENLIDSYVDVDVESEKADYNKKSLRGFSRNPDDYNYKVLYTKGFAPTYQFLNDYSPLIAESDNKITATGKGFKDTIETLKNAVFEGKKQVEKLAEHLKDPAGSVYQSCFNVWHWLQTNVNYNFDRQGKEDIRLPARTWLDRERGVDCDCLSVFAFCLLANMGLKPVFEIVAFFGRDDYSHIYVNCEGVIVDRVLNKFNERAPFITKIKKMEVPVYQLSGISGFDGLNDTVLKNIRNQNPLSHNCSIRKNIAYERMRGNPVEQRAFAMFLPYMADVDLHNGALYFYRPEFAKVATWADSLLMNYYKNASQNTDLQGIELGKLFKKIGKALKKAAKSVAKATKKVVKATGNAVKSVAKATANTVKAAAKSTVNAVKATANVTKAAAQLATGNAKKAKATIKKAATQAKSAVVNPIKQAAKDTKNVTKTAIDTIKTVVKETVINPTKTAVKMVGKLVKVLLIKINPVTVLMRNSLRGLIALNFLGLASKLAVGQMTEANALAAGYDKDMYDKAVKAYNRVKKFFKSLGGDVSKLEKTIEKGAKRKALFKKDNNYNINTPVNESDLQGLGALGEPVTIGTMLAAVGSFFAKIWGWIKNIAPKVANFVKNSGVGERLKEAGLRKLDEKLGNKTNSENDSEGIIDDGTTNNTTTDNKKSWLLPALVIAGVGAAVALSGNKKK